MTPQRPPEHQVYDGTHVVISGRVCAILNRKANLDAFHLEVRGSDPELDAALAAMKIAQMKWASSASGTSLDTPAEPAGSLKQEWFTTTEAGNRLGISDRAIRKAIDEKRLSATRVDSTWKIHVEDLEHYAAARGAA